VTIGHNALVHSSVIENNVLIGQASVLVGGCVIGTGSIVGAGAVVRAKMTVPPRSLVVGVPATVVREARPEDERWTVKAAEHYVELASWNRDHIEGER
jgi:carbonic anhydrase/acetyltransferase-like protein (isoleucine patch superfamily)